MFISTYIMTSMISYQHKTEVKLDFSLPYLTPILDGYSLFVFLKLWQTFPK